MKVIKVSEVPEVQIKDDPVFTGPVTMQPLIGKTEKPNMGQSDNFDITMVSFGQGVRNKFHTHSSEQILIATEGKGVVATENEEVTVGPGDVILIPAGEKHWHGAAPGSTFSHLYVMPPDSKITVLEK